MIHVDVKADHRGHQYPRAFLVQTSTDGGGWKTQYIVEVTPPPFYMSESDSIKQARREAEYIARVFKTACEYAGANTKGTSCGYEL